MPSNLLQMHLKWLQKEPFNGNIIADRITKISKISPKKNSEANEEEILWGRFVHSELRHKIIDDTGLEEKSYDDLRLI